MARRKRKDEEPDWVPPEFDEVGYMRKEIEGARAAVATIAWAVVGAIAAFLLYSVSPFLAFFAGIAVGFGMYFVFPLFGIRTESFKRRDWTSHGVTYFFAWLAFWIVLLNPPFGDFTDPTVQGVSVSPYHTGYTGGLLCAMPMGGSVTVSGAGNNSLYILFRASDNVGLASIKVNITQGGSASDAKYATLAGKMNPCAGHSAEVLPSDAYSAIVPITASVVSVAIIATDHVGRTAVASFQIFIQ